MWGPIPFQWPGGSAPGYAVMVQEPPQSSRVTVERHFMPDVGLVREVLIVALGSKMLSRQEMVLTSHNQTKQ